MYLMDSLKKYVDKQNANEHGQNVGVTEIDGVWWHEYGNTTILYCKMQASHASVVAVLMRVMSR